MICRLLKVIRQELTSQEFQASEARFRLIQSAGDVRISKAYRIMCADSLQSKK